MSPLNSLLKYKPYTFRPLKTWRSMLRCFGYIEYGIYFEDLLVRTTTLDYENLKEFINLMNTAWMLGAGSGWAVGQVEANVETKRKLEAAVSDAKIARQAMQIIARKTNWRLKKSKPCKLALNC